MHLKIFIDRKNAICLFYKSGNYVLDALITDQIVMNRIKYSAGNRMLKNKIKFTHNQNQ